MNRMKNVGLILCGFVLGLALSSPAARAVESLKVTLSTNRILVDGQEVRLTAYNINGNNYVMLRDVGKTVGFEVYWDGDAKCVQVESGKPYTGEAPAKAEDTKSTEQHVQTDIADAKQNIVDRTNALRRAKGVAALRVNDKLMQAAQVRADEMAANTVYSHTRPNGEKFNTVTDCPHMAENIHRIADWVLSDQTLAERAVADWSASATHNKNMVNPKLSEIGVGLARGVNDNSDPCWYCVQLFLYDGYSISSANSLAVR